MKHALWLALAILSCGGEASDTTKCDGQPPPCEVSCGGDVVFVHASCVDGRWTCDDARVERDYPCNVCEDGAWRCDTACILPLISAAPACTPYDITPCSSCPASLVFGLSCVCLCDDGALTCTKS